MTGGMVVCKITNSLNRIESLYHGPRLSPATRRVRPCLKSRHKNASLCPSGGKVVNVASRKSRTTKTRSSLEALRPPLRAVVNGENHDAGLLDGICGNKWRMRNNQLTGAGNPTSSARHGEGT